MVLRAMSNQSRKRYYGASEVKLVIVALASAVCLLLGIAKAFDDLIAGGIWVATGVLLIVVNQLVCLNSRLRYLSNEPQDDDEDPIPADRSARKAG